MLTDIERKFWERTDKRGPDDCWPWLGTLTDSGYGRIYIAGRRIIATRISWEIANGKPFPEGLIACHRCDNPICVNPAHIWPGTSQDNIDDCIAKGRFGVMKPAAECAQGHELTDALRMVVAGRMQCRTCWEQAKLAGFGHNAICRKCGHPRFDDYRQGNSWRCRACNTARRLSAKRNEVRDARRAA